MYEASSNSCFSPSDRRRRRIILQNNIIAIDENGGCQTKEVAQGVGTILFLDFEALIQICFFFLPAQNQRTGIVEDVLAIPPTRITNAVVTGYKAFAEPSMLRATDHTQHSLGAEVNHGSSGWIPIWNRLLVPTHSNLYEITYRSHKH